MENIPAKSLNSGGGLDANASKPSQMKDASHVRRRDRSDGISVDNVCDVESAIIFQTCCGKKQKQYKKGRIIYTYLI